MERPRTHRCHARSEHWDDLTHLPHTLPAETVGAESHQQKSWTAELLRRHHDQAPYRELDTPHPFHRRQSSSGFHNDPVWYRFGSSARTLRVDYGSAQRASAIPESASRGAVVPTAVGYLEFKISGVHKCSRVRASQTSRRINHSRLQGEKNPLNAVQIRPPFEGPIERQKPSSTPYATRLNIEYYSHIVLTHIYTI